MLLFIIQMILKSFLYYELLHSHFYSLPMSMSYMVSKVQRGSRGFSWTKRQRTSTMNCLKAQHWSRSNPNTETEPKISLGCLNCYYSTGKETQLSI